MKNSIEKLIESILTEVPRFAENEEDKEKGPEYWNAYNGATDLSEFIKEARNQFKIDIIEAKIEENKSILEYVKTHGDERLFFVLNDRIKTLENERDEINQKEKRLY